MYINALLLCNWLSNEHKHQVETFCVRLISPLKKKQFNYSIHFILIATIAFTSINLLFLLHLLFIEVIHRYSVVTLLPFEDQFLDTNSNQLIKNIV